MELKSRIDYRIRIYHETKNSKWNLKIKNSYGVGDGDGEGEKIDFYIHFSSIEDCDLAKNIIIKSYPNLNYIRKCCSGKGLGVRLI